MNHWLGDRFDKRVDLEGVLSPSMRTMVVAVDTMDVREDLTDTALPVGDWCGVRLPEKEKNLLLFSF